MARRRLSGGSVRSAAALPLVFAIAGPLPLGTAIAGLSGIAIAGPFGCGSGLPRPATGQHPRFEEQAVEVPYPPPVAKVEIIPRAPSRAAVWLDGSWIWQAGRWVWLTGGWVEPPRGAYLAPWTTLRAKDGRLYFLPDAWYLADARPIPRPRILLSAASAVGAAMEESQRREPDGG